MLPDPQRQRGDMLLNAIFIGLPAGLLAAATGALWHWSAGVVVGLIAVVVWWLSWGKWRRRSWLIQQEFPAAWREVLERDVDYYQRLDADGKQRFEQMTQVFLAEVPVRGVGCQITERDSVFVAAGAIIPVFGFPIWEYSDLEKVLIRPHAFATDFDEGQTAQRDAAGMVTSGGLMNGVVVLALDELREGFAEADAHNVSIHEFAHLVDRAMGGINGIPPGLTQGSFQPWMALMQEELRRGARRSAVLRRYAYTNEQEFFAVASEHFFERPDELRRKNPELYRLLSRIFRQDLVSRFSRKWRR